MKAVYHIMALQVLPEPTTNTTTSSSITDGRIPQSSAEALDRGILTTLIYRI